MRLAISIAVLLSLAASCATPSQRFSARADGFGFEPRVIKGTAFYHRLYINQAALEKAHGKTLHVYIDGDGTPWEHGLWPARDPTSRNPLILELLKKDGSPALLLGRPCYYGLNDSDPCTNEQWTSHRYSPRVVDSMKAALHNWMKKNDYREAKLFGFSGGGTLAWLMAYDNQDIITVVTLAANLDTTAWAARHHYQAMEHSLNPATREPLSARVRQIHFVGLKDNNVNADIIERFCKRQINATYVPKAGFDHTCCWAAEWVRLLAEIERLEKNQ